MLTAPITAADLAPSLLAAERLDGDATELRDCDDFARWCDERAAEAREHFDAATDH